MNRAQKQCCVVALVLAAGGAGVMIGRVARSAEEELFVNFPTVEAQHVYRHNSHYTVAIQLPASAGTVNPAYKFTAKTKVAPAAFTDATMKHKADWAVYSHGPDTSGQKMLITFVAKHPDGASWNNVANGTGTILVSTSEPDCPTTTGLNISVAPLDGGDVP